MKDQNTSGGDIGKLPALLQKHQAYFASVVPFDPTIHKIRLLDFTAANQTLTADIIRDTETFSQYINQQLAGYTYGIGGYNELRTLYGRSTVFDDNEEPRRLHFGVDVWGPAGTPVFAPLHGTIHSFAFNNQFGDYGATIILQHELDSFIFHTLYGHLSLADLDGLQPGAPIAQGQPIAHFGPPHENGSWPPHLHFQIIEDMQGKTGDYPGVCKFSKREFYLANSPDADLILQMMRYAK